MFLLIRVSQTKVGMRDENKYHEMTYDFNITAATMLAKVNEELIFSFLTGARTDPTM